MPPKKDKKKKEKKIKMIGHERPSVVLKRLIKRYEATCVRTNSTPCLSLVSMLKEFKEDEKIPTKFILEPPALDTDPPVLLEVLIETLRKERYTLMSDLYVWKLPLKHEQLSELALMLEQGSYPLKSIEMWDCLLEPYSLRRLALSFNITKSLSSLVFDQNELGDEGAAGLSQGLMGNETIISLSMCYCGLGIRSGEILGQVLSSTAVRELYLDGNDLECEGAIELIKMCVDHAETEHAQALEEEERKRLEEEERRALQAAQASTYRYSPVQEEPAKKEAKKKKKKGKKKSKEPPPPPPVGPWIYKLHLADNAIDSYSATGISGKIAPLICMRLFRSLIAHSKCLEELDLEDNLIGDMGGRELVEGLEERSDAGMGSVKMRTTHRMNADTFNTLVKLGVAMKKKKKKGKKKKK